jgi:hypothetical protein
LRGCRNVDHARRIPEERENAEERENMIFVLINILVAAAAAATVPTTSATYAIRRLLLYHEALARSAFSSPKGVGEPF